MQIINQFNMNLLSRSSNEGFARAAISAFAAQLDPTVDEITELKTAVSEAVTNSVIHGYDCNGGVVTISAELFDNGITVTVEDNGLGIDDVIKARTPLFTTKPAEGRSGMGFTVMEMFMDTVEVTSQAGAGTKVCMTKYFRRT